jgi:hypothetical protein
MAIIKPMLREELENSKKLKVFYEKKIAELSRETVLIKKIKGHEYSYAAKREGKRVVYRYLGKISKEDTEKYKAVQRKRAELRKNISIVKKQIKYLKGALRGKEPI